MTYPLIPALGSIKLGIISILFIVTMYGVATSALAFWWSDPSDGAAENRGALGAEQNSQTMTLLRAARNIDPNPSRGGGDISIVDGVALVADGSPFSSVALEAPRGPDQISLYLVQEGDTLSQVADMFNVSVNTIVWANDLRSNRDIRPGQTLLILPVSGVQHTVAKGDTIQSLAKRYGGDAGEIVAFNDLPENGELSVGATITIPGGEIPDAPKKPQPARGGGTSVAASGYFVHPLPGSVRTQGLHGYNAIDYGAPLGTPIRAAAAGTVIVSRVGGWNGGYGNYIVIDHPNGTQTLYSHNSKHAVWEGQKVVQGQVIGYVGSTGRSTGNHLHFEVRGAKNPSW